MFETSCQRFLNCFKAQNGKKNLEINPILTLPHFSVQSVSVSLSAHTNTRNRNGLPERFKCRKLFICWEGWFLVSFQGSCFPKHLLAGKTFSQVAREESIC